MLRPAFWPARWRGMPLDIGCNSVDWVGRNNGRTAHFPFFWVLRRIRPLAPVGRGRLKESEEDK